jgi:nicotinate-nucleotide adenylyltransferase
MKCTRSWSVSVRRNFSATIAGTILSSRFMGILCAQAAICQPNVVKGCRRMFKRSPHQPRIGIYAGAFNPVHAGHIAFALQAIERAGLDTVYFLPERRPRHKKGVEHFAHRTAMLKIAVRPHPKLKVLETDDVSFTVRRTLPSLQQRFAGAKLVFLMGSDIALHVHEWPLAGRMFEAVDVVVGLRAGQRKDEIMKCTQGWRPQPSRVTLLTSYAPDVSSHRVREALAARVPVKGLLMSVAQYSNRHWLYVSLAYGTVLRRPE